MLADNADVLTKCLSICLLLSNLGKDIVLYMMYKGKYLLYYKHVNILLLKPTKEN